MSDSEDEKPSPSRVDSDDNIDDGPSTSWGAKKRTKRPIISDSESEDDAVEEITIDAESGDSDSSSGAPGAETCAICLGRMRGEVGSPDACEHSFCKFCLLEWAKNNPTCPQDRIPFTLVLVRKTFGGPIDKEVPVKKLQKEKETAEVIDLTLEENPTYCEVCNDCDREDRLLLCDGCDLGYHLECLDPPLSEVPVEEWFCPTCASPSVPDVQSNRHGASSSHRRHERRRSSTSRSSSRQQEPRRIPRTRATERIRASIKRKKKRKRQKRKESKRAKIASGELEDKRPPIPHLTELKHFVEGDNDVDAAHTEDIFAERLLAGAIHEAARQPDQRKADAAKLLRHVAFIPQASYSGRAKNKVINIVNTQCEDNGTDLLSGILENQTIAFAKAKQLVLTNDRKLTQQPGSEVPCDHLFQEDKSLMSEPLPSQRKTPEKNDNVESSSPSEKSKSNLNQKEGPSNNNTHNSHHEGRHRSLPTSTYHSSSNYKNDYSYASCSKTNNHDRRPDEHKRDSEHNHSRYSHHSRSYSSWKYKSTYEPSCSSYKEKTSYSRNREKDHREHGRHGSYRSRDRSPHNRSKSAGRESKKEKKDYSISSKHERSRDHKSHSSRSHKSHSKFKGESSHSSAGERRIRSQWSFSYFNSENSFMNKNGSSHNNLSSSNSQYGNKSGDDKESESKSSATKLLPQETESTTSLKKLNESSSSVDETESVVKLKSGSTADNMNKVKAILDACSKTIQKGSNYADKSAESNLNLVLRKEQVCRKMSSPVDSELDDDSDNQSQTSYSSVHVPDIKIESKSTEKSQLKSSHGKKSKMSSLFGELEDNVREDSIERKHTEELENQKEKEKKDTKCKNVKKSKSKYLFGFDSDDDTTSNALPHTQLEFSESKSELALQKNTDRKSLIGSFQCGSKQNVSCNTDNKYNQISKNIDVYDKKNFDKNTSDHMKKDSVFESKMGAKCHVLKHEISEKKVKSHEKCDAYEKSGKSHEKREKSHEMHITDENRAKFPDRQHVDEKQPKSHGLPDVDVKRTKSHGKHDVDENRAKSLDTPNVDDKQVKSHGKHDDQNCISRKMDTKTNGFGMKYLHKNVDVYDNKNDLNQHSTCTPNSTNSVKSKQVNNTSENSKTKESEIGKNRKSNSELIQSKHKAEEKHTYNGKKKRVNNNNFIELFGDIDDVESSSNSNLFGMELTNKDTKKTEEKPITFERKIDKEIDIQEDNQVADCSNNSSWMLHTADVEDHNETDDKELETFGCYSTSNHKSSSETKQDYDLRIKQQKALLEVRVVQEVKKALNPYYHSKSITKEVYKQIVAKCVKKVVTAECGDVIEPEKMHNLVLRYIEYYKHRQSKCHT